MLINSIQGFKDSLVISGEGAISVKAPFLLDNPSRIVFDLSNSALVSTNLVKEFNFTNGDKARSAQFDPQTVRIAIETKEPDKYKTILSPDSKSLIIYHQEKSVFSEEPNDKTAPSLPANKSYSLFKVVIDAGHGGNDCGAQREGIFEKDITLNVAKKVQENLTNAGVRVIMTRNTDDTVSLKARTEITNLEKPDLFLSIHVNSCESQNITGIETHWYNDNSEEFAGIIQEKLVKSINTIDRGIINSRFYVIHHTNVPAVLVEIGFISNDIERCQLITEERQNITAKAISEGILQFLNLKLEKP